LTQSLQDTQLDLQKQKVLHQNTLQELESLQLENEKLYHDIAHAQEMKKSEQKRKEARYEKLFKIMQTENETLEQASKNSEKFERALKEVSRVVKDDRMDSKDKLVYLRSMMILQQL
jgi:thiamine pyrophosphate-dependent acetolactate synthase large subunit-like protein